MTAVALVPAGRAGLAEARIREIKAKRRLAAIQAGRKCED